MGKNYFGFAMSSTMFADGSLLTKRTITAENAKANITHWIADDNFNVCLNPSHQATITAMATKYGIEVTIPEVAPRCSLQDGDSLLILQVSGLPRLDATRHEYTPEEIEKASFSFDLWHCGAPCAICGGSPTGNCLDCPFCGMK